MNHKKGFLFVALTAALVFAFTASAYATVGPSPPLNVHARTFNWMVDYYTWGTPIGSGVFADPITTPRIQDIGANPDNPGVHGGYLATTAKCGICHSVHRARGDGIKLLDTQIATCAGCHIVGSGVTHVEVNWSTVAAAAGPGVGPHRGWLGPAGCQYWACHLNNPHGAGGSEWAIVAEKLLNPLTDTLFTTALANPVSSGITPERLDSLATSTWTTSTESLVRTGYNCNLCHASTMLAVVGSWTVDFDGPGPRTPETQWWAEDRRTNVADPVLVPKTGHPGIGSTAATSRAGLPIAWAPVTDCESCHDQTDALTRTGFTFPHGQTPIGPTSFATTERAFLWMGWAGSLGETLTPVRTHTEKAFDGNCLKCHRSAGAAAGVGITY